MERESFKSRAGFLLVSAGCAIGIGNVWKFPWLVGQNGGGLFVLIYLLFLAVLGLPVLSMELAVGRASRQSAVGAYKVLKPEAPAWQLHGWASMLGNYVLMMFYTTVSGWMLSYFVKFATGTFDGMQLEKVDAVFGAMLLNGGTYGGHRFLSRRALDWMTSPLVDDTGWLSEPGNSYAKFMRVCTDPGRTLTFSSPGEYGWGGWLGTQFMNLPRERMTILFMQNTNGALATAWNKIRNVVLAEVG